MEQFEELVKEQKELKEKFVKLVDFMQTEEFFSLSINNRKVLTNQKIAMELYLSALNTRIFEDIDKITVPDLAMFGLFGSVFGNNAWGNPSSNPETQYIIPKN